jgi:hypothetical protein
VLVVGFNEYCSYDETGGAHPKLSPVAWVFRNIMVGPTHAALSKTFDYTVHMYSISACVRSTLYFRAGLILER